MMKKIALLFIALVGALSMQAEEAYAYLTFETTDGTKVSVSASSLTISISGTTLTTGDQQFTLTNLSKMYFSTSDESTATGIDSVVDDTLDEATEIYDLQGHKISKAQMQKGVYIVKAKDKTYKIAVK
jgi:ethanolamine utilization protein EutA (predicted chaperonin)